MGLYFYNTDSGAGNDLNRCHLLIKHRIAATSGPWRFGEQLRKLSPGDSILMYADGHGIIACGTVLKKWDEKPHNRPKFYAGQGVDDLGEYRIAVDWTDNWITNSISLKQLQKATGNNFVPRGAIRKVVKHRLEIERLIDRKSGDALPAPRAADVVPPPRVKLTVNRVVRDTACSRRIKLLHGYKCQLCGRKLKLRSGGFYAEAHHIRPLGGKHRGLDIAGNIVCVCPNHHALLDYGAIRLAASTIRYFGEGHAIDRESIDYHNNEIFGQCE